MKGSDWKIIWSFSIRTSQMRSLLARFYGNRTRFKNDLTFFITKSIFQYLLLMKSFRSSVFRSAQIDFKTWMIFETVESEICIVDLVDTLIIFWCLPTSKYVCILILLKKVCNITRFLVMLLFIRHQNVKFLMSTD